jgi:glycosyltransferase involved in cell wall biosynthesis
LTGIDRVELAYLRRLASDETPLFLLVRTVLGYILLDQAGAKKVLARFEGQAPWGKADLVGRLSRKTTPEKQAAEADLRRLAMARCRKGGLVAMLKRRMPTGSVYLNVGHSNLTEEVLSAWRNLPDVRITVLVHDTIPMDFPQFQRPGTPEKFAAIMKCVGQGADLVVYNSKATRADAERWFKTWGRCPFGVVAHLGVDLPKPDPAHLPNDLDLVSPYFVTLGTIEPRKNHALLLDIWDQFACEMDDADIPNLIIVGTRGWRNEDVFHRLDNLSSLKNHVFERAGYDDAALAALLVGAAGFLFPSLAEGFGLPPIEAASLNVPVICSDLPVYDEFLGNIPVYLKPGDVYSWKQSITSLAREKRAGHERDAQKVSQVRIPNWADHFNFVLKVT